MMELVKSLCSALIKGLVVSFVLVFSVQSGATTTTYKPLSMQVNPTDRLEISGFKGSIQMEADDSLKSLTVSLRQVMPKVAPPELKDSSDEWLFSLQRVDDKIEAKVGSPLSKSLWAKLMANPAYLPEFHLVIKGPSLPLTLSWRQGPIALQGWNSSIRMSTMDSVVKIAGGEGGLFASQQEGSLSVESREGTVEIDTYKVTANLSKIKGPIYVQNFSGKSSIQESEGKISIYSYTGEFSVKDGKGQIQFDSDRGKIVVAQYQGDLTSETDIGSVYATLVGQSRVKVKTRQGFVSLRLPNSGANVNVGTENGSLNVPNYLRLTRLPNLQLMTGRLRGKNSGRVYVRTESGGIRIR